MYITAFFTQKSCTSIGPKFGMKTLVKIANLKPLEQPIFQIYRGASGPPSPFDHTTMSSCSFDVSLALNADIAGVGVRISTYVQAFLAGELRCLSIASAISRGYHCVAFVGRNLQSSLHIYNHEHFCHRRSPYPRLLFRSSNQPTRVHMIPYTHIPHSLVNILIAVPSSPGSSPSSRSLSSTSRV